jgi:hypothetical protein
MLSAEQAAEEARENQADYAKSHGMNENRRGRGGGNS